MSGCNRQEKIDGSSNSCSCSQNDKLSVTGESVVKDVATVLKDVASVLKDVALVVKDVASLVKDVSSDVKYLKLKLSSCDDEKMKQSEDKFLKDDDNGRLNHYVFDELLVTEESVVKDVAYDVKNLDLKLWLCDDVDSGTIKQFGDKSQKDDDNGRSNNHVFDKSWVTGESASKDVAFDEKNLNLKLGLCDDDDDSEKIKQFGDKSQKDDDSGRLNHHVFHKTLVTGESSVKDVASDVEKLDLKLYLYNDDSDFEKIEHFGDKYKKDDDNERLNHVFDKSSVTEESAVNDVASDVKNLNLELYLCDDGEAEKIKQFGDESQKDDDNGRLIHHVFDKPSVTEESCVKDVASDVKNLKLEPCLCNDHGEAEKIKKFGDESRKDDDNGKLNHHVFDKSSVTGESAVNDGEAANIKQLGDTSQKDDDNGRLNHHLADKSSVTQESAVNDVESDVKNLNPKLCLCDDDGEVANIEQFGDKSQKDGDNERLGHHVFDESSVIRESAIKDVASDVKNLVKDVAFDVKSFKLKPILLDDDDNSKKMKQFGDKSEKHDDNKRLIHHIFDYSPFMHVASDVNNLKMSGYTRQGNRCASGKSGIRIKRTVQKFKAKIDGSLYSSCAKRLNHHVFDKLSVTKESAVKDVAFDVKDLKLKPCVCDDDGEAEKIKQFGDKSQKDDDNGRLNHHVYDKSSVTGESCVKDVASDVKNLKLEPCLCDDDGEAEKKKQFGNKSQKDDDNGRLNHHVSDKSSVTGDSCVKDVASDVKNLNLKPCLRDDDSDFEKIKKFGDKSQKHGDNGRLSHHVFDKSSVIIKDMASDVKKLVKDVTISFDDADDSSKKMKQFGDKSQKDNDNRRLIHHKFDYSSLASDVNNSKMSGYNRSSNHFASVKFDSRIQYTVQKPKAKIDGSLDSSCAKSDKSSVTGDSGFIHPACDPKSLRLEPISFDDDDSSKKMKQSGDKSQKEDDNERISHHIFDICPKKVCSAIKLKTPLHVKNKERRNQMKQAMSGDNNKILRSGMVLTKGYISPDDQISIVKTCRDLGIGDGGFYQPGYRNGKKQHLKMMCLGKNWDPERHMYTELRQVDNSKPPGIPEKFHDLVKKAIEDSNEFIRGNAGSYDERKVIPSMSPNICIVRFYSKSGSLGLHQDKDESEVSLKKGLPVVSFSIGDSAEFLYGETRSIDDADKVTLESGDVLIYGGKSRLIYHGVTGIFPNTAPTPLMEATDMLPGRLNLTFRMF